MLPSATTLGAPADVASPNTPQSTAPQGTTGTVSENPAAAVPVDVSKGCSSCDKLTEENRTLRARVEALEALKATLESRLELASKVTQCPPTRPTPTQEQSVLMLQQLLKLQKQLGDERAHRDQLISAAVESVEKKFTALLLEQHDVLESERARVLQHEATIALLERSIQGRSAPRLPDQLHIAAAAMGHPKSQASSTFFRPRAAAGRNTASLFMRGCEDL